MQDHDQRFKLLIQEFFVEFLLLFFADWAKRLDCATVEWLNQEFFLDPPDGDRTILDLVAKVHARQEIAGYPPNDANVWLALVHIEIESPDKAAPLRPRMFRSYTELRKQHGLPVLPIALFLKVGLDGIGIEVYEEYFWELRPVRFEYLYVGLPALNAVEYVQGDNPLGWALAALMKIPKDQAVTLGMEALRRIAGADLSDQKRFYLSDCVEAYLPLDEQSKSEFEASLAKEKSGVPTMNQTTYDRGVLKGRQEGRQEGAEHGRELLRVIMEERFGALPPSIAERLQFVSMDDLIHLGKMVAKAGSLEELRHSLVAYQPKTP